jgi:hypothetical protein
VRISLMNRVYVMLDIYKLQNQFLSLQYRTRAMRAMKPEIPVAEAEGYELSPLTSGADSEKSTSSAVAKSPEMNEKVEERMARMAIGFYQERVCDPSSTLKGEGQLLID